jgi:hypothetical protein
MPDDSIRRKLNAILNLLRNKRSTKKYKKLRNDDNDDDEKNLKFINKSYYKFDEPNLPKQSGTGRKKKRIKRLKRVKINKSR